MMSFRRTTAVAGLIAGVVCAVGSAEAAGASGSIAGTVSSDANAVCVLVLDANGQSVASAPSDPSGRYTVDDIPAGTWNVEFVPDNGCLAEDTGDAFQYYREASTPAAATPVTVVAGQTTAGVNGALVAGAVIKGTVTGTADAALPGVCAILEDPAGRVVVRQPTDDDGDYVLDQLPPGRFILQFVDDDCIGQQPSYASGYYGGAATADSASVIELRAGQLAGRIDAALHPLAGAPTGSGPAGGTDPGLPLPTTGSPPTGSPATGSSPTPGATTRRRTTRRAVVALSFASGGRWRVDTRGRLHLRLRCVAGGPACATTITVRRVRRVHRRYEGGAVAGSGRVLIAAGRSRALTVRLRGPHAQRLWLSLRIHGGRISSHTIIPVRWARTNTRSGTS